MKNIYNMTREEELFELAAKVPENEWCETAFDWFKLGVTLADHTMLEKACKWWKDNWMFGQEEIGTEHRDFMIEQFRKAMEK